MRQHLEAPSFISNIPARSWKVSTRVAICERFFGRPGHYPFRPVHEYDAVLKNILTRSGSSILEQLTGASSLRWLNVEIPKVSNRRADLLGELPDGNLVHIELQSRNEKDFPLRMAEYLFGIRRKYGKMPRQVALYVGEAPLRMKDSIEGPGVSVRFHLVDIRELDGEQLFASANSGDNILAVLTRLGEQPDAVRRILKRIAAGQPGERDGTLAELFIIAGLRKMESEARREARNMPILNDIMDNEVVGPLLRQGRAEGRVEGQVEILHTQIQKRFGRVPPAVAQRLAALKPAQLKRVALRLLDAQRIEDLFAR
jgi:predicted transposase YdaD